MSSDSRGSWGGAFGNMLLGSFLTVWDFKKFTDVSNTDIKSHHHPIGVNRIINPKWVNHCSGGVWVSPTKGVCPNLEIKSLENVVFVCNSAEPPWLYNLRVRKSHLFWRFCRFLFIENFEEILHYFEKFCRLKTMTKLALRAGSTRSSRP